MVDTKRGAIAGRNGRIELPKQLHESRVVSAARDPADQTRGVPPSQLRRLDEWVGDLFEWTGAFVRNAEQDAAIEIDSARSVGSDNRERRSNAVGRSDCVES